MQSECLNLHQYAGLIKFKKRINAQGKASWDWSKTVSDYELHLSICEVSVGIAVLSSIWNNTHDTLVKHSSDAFLSHWPDNWPQLLQIIDDPEHHFRILML
jgi:hypothetical protein